jgi:hypothetical protein
MLKATKIIRDKEKGSWAVQVFHKESGRYYWLDVTFVEDGDGNDLRIDWNQYIFYNTDEDDTERKAFQENCDNFEEALEAVRAALFWEGEVVEDDYGAYRIGVDWKAKSWELK